MATAELAVAMPVLLVLLALALSALMVGVDQVRCVDAARAGVRLLARGDSTGEALDVARRSAPERARVSARASRSTVSVTVEGTVRGPLRWLGLSWTPHATAVSEKEESLKGVGEGGPG